PAGWAVLGASALAGGSNIMQMCEEASSTIKDVHGQTINKNYVVSQLSYCQDDLKSLLDSSVTIRKDGVMSVNEGDAKKIAVTKTQLDAFVKQFKASIPEESRVRLSKALDEFFHISRKRNDDMITYSKAVITVYQKLKDRLLAERQSGQIAS